MARKYLNDIDLQSLAKVINVSTPTESTDLTPKDYVDSLVAANDPYVFAVQGGFSGTKAEWIASLEGDSAYDIAVNNGYVGTESQWLNSLTTLTSVALVMGASVNWDLSDRLASLTLTGDVSLTVSNLVNGQTYALLIKQDTIGGHSITFSSTFKFLDGINPNIDTNADIETLITFIAISDKLYCLHTGNYV